MNAIEVDHLCHRYKGRDVYEDLSFALPSGGPSLVLGVIMAQDPDLLILDEYSMGLDAGYRRLFLVDDDSRPARGTCR